MPQEGQTGRTGRTGHLSPNNMMPSATLWRRHNKTKKFTKISKVATYMHKCGHRKLAKQNFRIHAHICKRRCGLELNSKLT